MREEIVGSSANDGLLFELSEIRLGLAFGAVVVVVLDTFARGDAVIVLFAVPTFKTVGLDDWVPSAASGPFKAVTWDSTTVSMATKSGSFSRFSPDCSSDGRLTFVLNLGASSEAKAAVKQEENEGDAGCARILASDADEIEDEEGEDSGLAMGLASEVIGIEEEEERDASFAIELASDAAVTHRGDSAFTNELALTAAIPLSVTLPLFPDFFTIVMDFACGDGDLELKGEGDLDLALTGFATEPLTSGAAFGGAFPPDFPTCHGFSYSSLFAFSDASSTSDGCLTSVCGGGVDSLDEDLPESESFPTTFFDEGEASLDLTLVANCLVGDVSLVNDCLLDDVAGFGGDASLVNACFVGVDSLETRLIGDASLDADLDLICLVGVDSLLNEFFLVVVSVPATFPETPGDFSLV